QRKQDGNVATHNFVAFISENSLGGGIERLNHSRPICGDDGIRRFPNERAQSPLLSARQIHACLQMVEESVKITRHQRNLIAALELNSICGYRKNLPLPRELAHDHAHLTDGPQRSNSVTQA